MLTRPRNILVHPVEGTLGLSTIDGLFPGDSLWDGTPSVRFRARMRFSVWTYCGALNQLWRQESKHSPPQEPGPSHLLAG